jgi:hypothetical protein
MNEYVVSLQLRNWGSYTEVVTAASSDEAIKQVVDSLGGRWKVLASSAMTTSENAEYLRSASSNYPSEE